VQGECAAPSYLALSSGIFFAVKRAEGILPEGKIKSPGEKAGQKSGKETER
jgi:hypothetical protein